MTFKNGRDPVTMGCFSPRGDFFAFADAANYVYLHKLLLTEANPGGGGDDASVASGGSALSGGLGNTRATWTYLGR